MFMRLNLLLMALLGSVDICKPVAAQIPAGQTSKSMTAPMAKPSVPAAPDISMLRSGASYAIAFKNGRLTGVGREHLLQELTATQFVLIGESHYDHDTPIFVGALYRELHQELGFHHLVLEQDPIAIEDSLKAGARGSAMQIAALAKHDPYLFGFASDQDLQLLADVENLENNPDPVWGLEQTQGTTRYLDELARLSPTPALRNECETLLAAARGIESNRGPHGNYLSDDATAYDKMKTLREHFAAGAGSREKQLLDGLVKSAEIYSYYRRAEAGEFVGLLNNTVREALFKQEFIKDYHRAVGPGDVLPKALFKFGDEHMYHGLNPVMAFPIGNFAHEFAISNGLQAYSIAVLPLGSYSTWSELPTWIRPLLPASAPANDVMIDLRALRPYQKLFRAKVAEKEQWAFRAFINGYDAVVLLPNSRKADMALTGFPNPF
jgi:hypothetical protein